MGTSGRIKLRNERPHIATAAFGQNDEPEVPDRVIGAIPYLLPLLDALPYAKFLLLQFPYIARLLAPLAPLNALYNAVPFGPFLVFLGIYSGIVNNRSLSRFIRYNAMQAVLLDVLLIIPQVRFRQRGVALPAQHCCTS